jgi:hypothetical protein
MRSGFTLMESLVYVVVSTLLVGVFAHALVLFYHRMEIYGKDTAEYLSIFTALHFMARDIRNSSGWKYSDSQKILFTVNGEDRVWNFNKGRLIRLESGYASVVLYGITKGLFTFSKNAGGKVQGVGCRIRKGNTVFEQFVARRNGLIG